MHRCHRLLCLVFLSCAALLSADDGERAVTRQDCDYVAAPERFAAREGRARREVYERSLKYATATAANGAPRGALVAPGEIPRRNLVDEEIFAALEARQAPTAALSTDGEFLRRAMLDLTGTTPTPAEVRAFLADENPGKRDALIDRLLFSPGFTDKWTMWLGDLVQNTLASSNINQQAEGRNRLHEWLRGSIEAQKSFRDIAWELTAATGNTYDRPTSAANYPLKSTAPMGPAQDTYDMMVVRTSSMFLGMGHYDCLMCHDGRGHLDSLSSWGRGATRAEAQKMAAFFSRTRLTRYPGNDTSNYYNNSYDVTDVATGQYNLDTTSGNRPSRITMNGTQRVANYTPVYRDGQTPRTANWREEYATFLVNDPMFARNLANRLWKAMFGLALVEPVDTLDPARLDPSRPAPAAWGYQASNPVLLERLAGHLQATHFNLREFLRLLASSSTYQLSSRYDGEWNIELVPLYARHYPRRLEGEEVHDAIVRATGLLPSYTIGGWGEPVQWAMKLPEPVEPRSNGNALNFMNAFQRGNRDTMLRSQDGSILMWLFLMNNSFVTDRTRTTSSPALQAVARLSSNEAVVEELFLSFLSRLPTDYERGVALRQMAKSGTAQYTRNAAIEDLAWALINKIDFLYSY